MAVPGSPILVLNLTHINFHGWRRVELRGARLTVLGSQVDSREAATTDVIAIDQYVTCGGFRDTYELLLVFTSKLHRLLSCISANIFFMMDVADFFAPLIFPHADRAHASAQRAPAHRRARQRAQALLFYHAQAHVFLQHV